MESAERVGRRRSEGTYYYILRTAHCALHTTYYILHTTYYIHHSTTYYYILHTTYDCFRYTAAYYYILLHTIADKYFYILLHPGPRTYHHHYTPAEVHAQVLPDHEV